MKTKFFLITLTGLLALSNSASAQEAAPEAEVSEAQTFVYSLVCSSNDEMMANENLLTQIGSQPEAIQEATNMRDGFQKLVADPVAFMTSQIPVKDEALMQQALQVVMQQIPQQVLQAMASEYATANNVSAEEAMTAVLTQQAEITLNSYITNVKVGITAENCGLLNAIQPLITKSGCKSVSGAPLDMTAVTGLCQSVSKQLADLASAQEAIGQIQARTNQIIQFVQEGAQAQINPIQETMNAPVSDIVAIIDALIAPKVEEGAAPAVNEPAAP